MTETLDPQNYRPSQNQTCWPPRPLSVVGFTFDPATGTFDFSAVPAFDLSRLRHLWHAPSRKFLYARPVPRPFDLAAVDGTPVADAPMAGNVLKVRPDTTGMHANDEVIAEYDLASA